MEEEWRPCPDYEGLYEVSSDGRVRNSRTGYVIKARRGSCGYAEVGLFRSVKDGGNHRTKSVKVHRLVARAFVPNPEDKREVNHIDTNRMNPAAANLEWMDKYENHAHSASLGKYRAETNPKRAKKLPPEAIEDCRRRRAAGESVASLAAAYDVTDVSIYRVLYGRAAQNKPDSTRRSWNWRAALTDEELEIIAGYDRAMERVRLAQLEADQHRLAFTRVQNRALQRAKYNQLRADQRASQEDELQKETPP